MIRMVFVLFSLAGRIINEFVVKYKGIVVQRTYKKFVFVILY